MVHVLLLHVLILPKFFFLLLGVFLCTYFKFILLVLVSFEEFPCGFVTQTFFSFLEASKPYGGGVCVLH